MLNAFRVHPGTGIYICFVNILKAPAASGALIA